MTTTTNRLAGREPSRALYDHAAALLAAARGLEAATWNADALLALGPTLACLEATLDAVADATTQLGAHILERTTAGDQDRGGPASHRLATHAFRDLAASLEQSRQACARARVEARSVMDRRSRATDDDASEERYR